MQASQYNQQSERSQLSPSHYARSSQANHGVQPPARNNVDYSLSPLSQYQGADYDHYASNVAPTHHPQAPVSSEPVQHLEHQGQELKSVEFERGVKIHGTKAALTIIGSTTKKGVHTLNIEGANALGGGSKQFAWKDKTILQITAAEYRHFLAVLFGFMSSLEFKSHGVQKNKSLVIKRQLNGFFFSLNEGGKQSKAVPVSFDDAYLLGMYALDVYARNYPNVDSMALLRCVQIYAGMSLSPPQA